jgi:hypothetical protein
MPLTLEDKFEIMELTSKYNHTLNHFQAEAWADLFTADGVCEGGSGGTMVGRQALIEYVRSKQAAGRDRERRHITSNPIINGDGNHATLQLYVFTLTLGDKVEVARVAEYDDALVKENGRWKFQRRTAKYLAGSG